MHTARAGRARAKGEHSEATPWPATAHPLADWLPRGTSNSGSAFEQRRRKDAKVENTGRIGKWRKAGERLQNAERPAGHPLANRALWWCPLLLKARFLAPAEVGTRNGLSLYLWCRLRLARAACSMGSSYRGVSRRTSLFASGVATPGQRVSLRAVAGQSPLPPCGAGDFAYRRAAGRGRQVAFLAKCGRGQPLVGRRLMIQSVFQTRSNRRDATDAERRSLERVGILQCRSSGCCLGCGQRASGVSWASQDRSCASGKRSSGSAPPRRKGEARGCHRRRYRLRLVTVVDLVLYRPRALAAQLPSHKSLGGQTNSPGPCEPENINYLRLTPFSVIALHHLR